MKDKKFVVLMALAAVWLLLFFGTAMGELKLSPNVERAATAVLFIWFGYWTFTTLRWAKKPEPTEDTNAKEPNAPTQKESPKS